MRDEVLVQVRGAAVCVPRVAVARLDDDVRVLVEEDLALERQKGVRLDGVGAQLADCMKGEGRSSMHLRVSGSPSAQLTSVIKLRAHPEVV